MAQRSAVLLIVLATLLAAASYGATLLSGAPPVWAPWALALSIGLATTGFFIAGAIRRGRIAPVLVLTFVVVLIVVTGSFWIALGLPAHEGAGGPLLLGLPLRTAIVLIGVGLLPMGVLPLIYAWSFDHGILSEEDVARIRVVRDESGIAR